MLVAREELFGPILLVYTYAHLAEVIEHIASRDKPFALYIFSTSKTNIDLILDKT